MRTAAERTVVAYARALERALEELHGPPFVLSPRDWALAVEWHDRSVPLAAVFECLAAASDRRSRRRASRRSPPRLTDIQRLVNEAGSVIRAGRLPEIPSPRESARGDEVRELWNRSREKAGAESPMGLLIGSLLTRLTEGEDPKALDRVLDVELTRLVSADVLEEAWRFVDAELGQFQGRWTESELRDARETSLRTRLRRRLGLARLSGRPAPLMIRSDGSE